MRSALFIRTTSGATLSGPRAASTEIVRLARPTGSSLGGTGERPSVRRACEARGADGKPLHSDNPTPEEQLQKLRISVVSAAVPEALSRSLGQVEEAGTSDPDLAAR